MSGALLACLFAVGARADSYQARVVDVAGRVDYFSSGQRAGRPSTEGMPLQEGDRISTGEDGAATIALAEGSVIVLKPKTDFTVASLDRSKAEFGLTFGTLLAKIMSLASGEALQVRTPMAVAAVRGTEFGVSAEPGGQTRIGVFDEGKVEVSGHEGAPVLLKPGRETTVAAGRAPAAASRLVFFKSFHKEMRRMVRQAAAARRRRSTARPKPREPRREERRGK